MDGETLSLNHGRYSLSLSSHSAFLSHELPSSPPSLHFLYIQFSHLLSCGMFGRPRCKLFSFQWQEGSRKQFPHISSGPLQQLHDPTETSKHKEKPPLICQPVSREEKRAVRGKKRDLVSQLALD